MIRAAARMRSASFGAAKGPLNAVPSPEVAVGGSVSGGLAPFNSLLWRLRRRPALSVAVGSFATVP